MEQHSDGAARYGVEQGTDGSWLVVDYGPDQAARVAIGRVHNELDAHREADVLSQMETLTSSLPPLEDHLERLLTEAGQALDADHNVNHLLPPQQS